jgi:hypothetical protein
MRSVLQIALILTVLASACKAGGAETNLIAAPKVAITNLLAHKKEFKGKRVEVTGCYHSFFECSMLSPHQGNNSTDSLWIDTWVHVKPEYKDKIKLVAKGNVRVVGRFEYNELGSGHLNMCSGEITDLELFEPLK